MHGEESQKFTLFDPSWRGCDHPKRNSDIETEIDYLTNTTVDSVKKLNKNLVGMKNKLIFLFFSFLYFNLEIK